MIDLLITPAFAQAAQEATRKPAPIWPMLIVLFAIFYFFIIRPQHKKQKDTQRMLQEVSKGDHVITIGGISGIVLNIKEKKETKSDDDIIVIRTGDTTKLEMVRTSIARVLPHEGAVEQTS